MKWFSKENCSFSYKLFLFIINSDIFWQKNRRIRKKFFWNCKWRNWYIDLFFFIISFVLYFIITILFSEIKIFNYDSSEKEGNIAKLSKSVLNGTQGILYFTAIYSLIFTYYIVFNGNKLKNEYKYLSMIPTLMPKFYLFTINYYCLCYSEKRKKFELISGTSLISIYVVLFHNFYNFIKNIETEEELLLICMQIFLSTFLISFTIISFICLCRNKHTNW